MRAIGIDEYSGGIEVRRTSWTLWVIFVLSVCAKVQGIYIEIYSDTVIGDDEAYDEVFVYDTPPDNTTIDVVGGYVGWLNLHNSSIGNVNHEVGWLTPRENSTGNLYGSTGQLDTYDFSIANILGGSVLASTTVNDSSALNIYSGQLGDSVTVADQAIMNMYGGQGSSVNYNVGIEPLATLNNRGGDLGIVFVDGTLNLYGGSVYEGPYVSGGGTANIHGYDFEYWWNGHHDVWMLGGKWADGSPFSLWDVPAEGTNPGFVLHVIPEPATLLLLGLGCLFLIRKHRIGGN